MDWAEGETLGIHLDRSSLAPATLGTLRQGFATLAEFLEHNGIAHGDIQNENVIVSGNALRLIDYDGMFVTGMPEGQGSEVGHKHFQHPGRTTKLFGPKMDRFSFIALDVSLEAMQADASLHLKFREGGQAIIFKANDFADPSSSEVFRILNTMPALQESATRLAAVCVARISGPAGTFLLRWRRQSERRRKRRRCMSISARLPSLTPRISMRCLREPATKSSLSVRSFL
jgi:hypothetical protein